jgi:serine protease Do
MAPEDLREFWRRFFGGASPFGQEEQTGLGSGVIIDSKGLVLTNNHVVADADEVLVETARGKEYRATVRGKDPPTDIALLMLRDVDEQLLAANLGDSDSLRVGDGVIAIGSPFGLSLTVTSGIISAKSRTIGLGPFDEFLQTDAAINPGNSGGPLFDREGNVVGINTAIVASGQGIGFAVPIDLVKALLPQIEQSKTVVRGYLGLAIQDLTQDVAKSLGTSKAEGALVTSVVPEGPAARAGLRSKDIIIRLNDEAIADASQLSRKTALLPPGKKVAITYIRDGKTKHADVILGRRPAD